MTTTDDDPLRRLRSGVTGRSRADDEHDADRRDPHRLALRARRRRQRDDHNRKDER